ncbi:MAG: hypothetical protein J6J36_07725 [Clostridia bacterium]|nr:hypothetical protein [Clostridia bacterium]
MNLNKCERCGCFYVTEGNVCPSCAPKDTNEMSKLNNYFTENAAPITINELSTATGISQKNLSRFISEKNFEYKQQIKL